jgi:hypothetical protein
MIRILLIVISLAVMRTMLRNLRFFSEQVNYFENNKLHGSFKGVKGNLKKHIQYWKDMGANEFILGTISEGYVIPFSSNPPSMFFKK